MIGLDTNALARYFVDDRGDIEGQRQREAARRLIESGQALMLCKTVLLEFEWVLRGYYRFEKNQVLLVLRRILGMSWIAIEDRLQVERAVTNYESGFDLADALQHAAYERCLKVASFDDRGFSRRSQRMGLAPSVFVPR